MTSENEYSELFRLRHDLKNSANRIRVTFRLIEKAVEQKDCDKIRYLLDLAGAEPGRLLSLSEELCKRHEEEAVHAAPSTAPH